jgi:photosystem II stability/assembly factor-like uncharacterized protein
MQANPLPFAAAGFVALAFLPWMIPQYGQADVINASAVTVIEADPQIPGLLLAGTATAFVFRSRDGAASWESLPFPAASHAMLHSILIEAGNPGAYLIAVSSEIRGYAGVYRSLDQGATWVQAPALRGKQVWSLASWAVDPRVIAAGAEDGVYLTRDGGETWSSVSPPGPARPHPVMSLAFDPANSHVLYAGTPHLAWKTIDGGATWRLIHAGIPEDSDIFWIEVDSKQPRRLFLGACSGIYRSSNSGGSWASLIKSEDTTFRTYVVVRAPGTANIVYAGTSAGLLESPDGGSTWRTRLPETVRSVAFDPSDPKRMFLATGLGILRSEDAGAHFQLANRGLGAAAAESASRRDPQSSGSPSGAGH